MNKSQTESLSSFLDSAIIEIVIRVAKSDSSGEALQYSMAAQNLANIHHMRLPIRSE